MSKTQLLAMALMPARNINNLMVKLGFPHNMRDGAVFLRENGDFDGESRQEILDFIRQLASCGLDLDDWLRFKLSTSPEFVNQVGFFQQTADSMLVNGKFPKPLINGNDLKARGIKPSKVFGEILRKCHDWQIINGIVDKNEIQEFLTELLD